MRIAAQIGRIISPTTRGRSERLPLVVWPVEECGHDDVRVFDGRRGKAVARFIADRNPEPGGEGILVVMEEQCSPLGTLLTLTCQSANTSASVLRIRNVLAARQRRDR